METFTEIINAEYTPEQMRQLNRRASRTRLARLWAGNGGFFILAGAWVGVAAWVVATCL
jgi:hypothetical protein